MEIEGSFKGTLRRAVVYNTICDHRSAGLWRCELGPLVFSKPGYKHLRPRSAWRTLDRDLRRLEKMGLVAKRGDGKYYPASEEDQPTA